MANETVECPKCETNFGLWESGGYCTNPDCGAMHPEARQDQDDSGSDDESTADASSDSGGSDGVSADDAGTVETDAEQMDSGGTAGTIDADAIEASDSADKAGLKPDESTASEGQCPDCGETVSTDAAFCQYCGVELETDDEPEPVQPKSCPGCGTAVDPDQAFCAECGTELEPVPPKSEHALEAEPQAGSQPAAPAADAGTESDTDEPTPTGTGAEQSSTGQPMDDTDGSDTPSLPQIEFDIEGERLVVYDGDLVGSEFRQAFINAGGDRDDARYVHREHIEVDVRSDGIYLIDHGENATKVSGTRLEAGDEQQVEDGDTIELGNVVEAEARIS